MADPVLECVGLRKVFEEESGEVHAVAGIDLAVAPGEFVALMGPSGCGKSTLLHLLGAIARPTAGEVRIAGRTVSALTDDELVQVRREAVGLVFQAFNLVPVLSAQENVALPAVIAHVHKSDYGPRVDELLSAVGLDDRRSTPASRLSGGEQQRVAIARALILRPAILLADEPTGNLDTEAGRRVIDVIRRFHGGGQTIVLVTHDMKVASHAERIVFMRDGVVTGETRPSRNGEPSRLLSGVFDDQDD